MPVGGIFHTEDAMSFAVAVAQSYGLRLVRKGDELILEPTSLDSRAPGADHALLD
jgi:hypothetical protein